MAERKVGLACICNSNSLNQFLWYYSTYGKDTEWYALCSPNSSNNDYAFSYCEKLGFFIEVYRMPVIFSVLPLADRFRLFCKLFVYAFLRQKKAFAKKFIASYTNGLEFDEAVVLTDLCLAYGILCQLGDEKKIVILEDGLGEYFIHRRWTNLFHKRMSFSFFQSFLLAILGYANPAHCFPLKATRSCIKFFTQPEKALYTEYKEIKRLFDMAKTDIGLYQHCISLLFPNINDYFCEKKDCILFTTPLDTYTGNPEPYLKSIENYVKANFNSLLLKKHPKDKLVYDFGKDVKVTEIPYEIPGELLIPYLKEMRIIFADASNVCQHMDSSGCKIDFFYFNSLHSECLKGKNISAEHSYQYYFTLDEFKRNMSFFKSTNQIIELNKEDESVLQLKRVE